MKWSLMKWVCCRCCHCLAGKCVVSAGSSGPFSCVPVAGPLAVCR